MSLQKGLLLPTFRPSLGFFSWKQNEKVSWEWDVEEGEEAMTRRDPSPGGQAWIRSGFPSWFLFALSRRLEA